MPIYDISLPISESLVVWPGDPLVRITQPSHLARGDKVTISRLDIGAHTGTHVDAPAHFVPDGDGVETLSLSALVGPAWVVYAPEVDALSAEVLAALSIPPGAERVLFRTRNSDLWARGETEFQQDFVALTEDGAHWLVTRGVQLVGIDYLSIALFQCLIPVHRLLLNAGLVVVEGLNLSEIAPGRYRLVCLPLNIVGGDGAPARAILIDEEDAW